MNSESLLSDKDRDSNSTLKLRDLDACLLPYLYGLIGFYLSFSPIFSYFFLTSSFNCVNYSCFCSLTTEVRLSLIITSCTKLMVSWI